jgi:hypothetical protein
MLVHHHSFRNCRESAGTDRGRPVAIAMQSLPRFAPFLSLVQVTGGTEALKSYPPLGCLEKFAGGLTLPGQADRVIFS